TLDPPDPDDVVVALLDEPVQALPDVEQGDALLADGDAAGFENGGPTGEILHDDPGVGRGAGPGPARGCETKQIKICEEDQVAFLWLVKGAVATALPKIANHG